LKIISKPVSSKISLVTRVKRLLKNNFPFFFYSATLFRLFKTQKSHQNKLADAAYDLIIEFYTLGSDLGTKLKDRLNAKLILIYDSPVLFQYREIYQTKTIYDKRVALAEGKSVKAADVVVCYSKTVKEYVQKNIDAEGNFYVMPCIVWKNKDRHLAKPQCEIIGFIGSFLPWHKVSLLLEAFEKIASEFASLQLLMIGYGEEWNKIHELVKVSKYKDRITLTGYVSEEELELLKSKITVGAMPGSNWYGSPLKLFEYAEAEIPFIAPSTPSVLDLFSNNETALFIDSNNEFNSLVEKLRMLILDKNLAKNLSLKAKKMMQEEYSEAHQMGNFVKLVQKTISNGIKE
nr:glycosyltransferase [Bacteroidota bacterium]